MGVVGNTYLFLDWVLVVDSALGVDVYAKGDGAFGRKTPPWSRGGSSAAGVGIGTSSAPLNLGYISQGTDHLKMMDESYSGILWNVAMQSLDWNLGSLHTASVSYLTHGTLGNINRPCIC